MKKIVLSMLVVACFITAAANDGSGVSEKTQSKTTSASEDSHRTWTFDCGSQGWGEFNHGLSFKMLHQLDNEYLSSGHIELHNKAGNNASWLFGPSSEDINTDLYDYLHFSLSLENAGTLPEEGIEALFVWDISTDGAMNDLRTQTFKIYGGQNDYSIDLNGNTDWNGMVNINRIHLPQGDQRQMDILRNRLFSVWIG
ncbi:MAG: hypothetical protein V3V53_17595 [Bacteroidales bacterium]